MDLSNAVVKENWEGKKYIEIPQPPKIVYLENLEEQKASFEQMIAQTQEALNETHAMLNVIVEAKPAEILKDGNLSDVKVV